MPSIRNARHKATDTIKKNIKLFEKMSVVYRYVLKEYGKENLSLWREVYKRKYLGIQKFENDIKKGNKVLPEGLIKTLDEKLHSRRRTSMFFKILEKNFKVKKLYNIDKSIAKVQK